MGNEGDWRTVGQSEADKLADRARGVVSREWHLQCGALLVNGAHNVPGYCGRCCVAWPCPTIQLLDSVDELAAAHEARQQAEAGMAALAAFAQAVVDDDAPDITWSEWNKKYPQWAHLEGLTDLATYVLANLPAAVQAHIRRDEALVAALERRLQRCDRHGWTEHDKVTDVCRELAVWRQVGTGDFADLYWCAAHKPSQEEVDRSRWWDDPGEYENDADIIAALAPEHGPDGSGTL